MIHIKFILTSILLICILNLYFIENFSDEYYIKYNGINNYIPKQLYDYNHNKINKPLYPFFIGNKNDYHRIEKIYQPKYIQKYHNIKYKDLLNRPYYSPIVTDNSYFYKKYKNNIAYNKDNKNWKLKIDTVI